VEYRAAGLSVGNAAASATGRQERPLKDLSLLSRWTSGQIRVNKGVGDPKRNLKGVRSAWETWRKRAKKRTEEALY